MDRKPKNIAVDGVFMTESYMNEVMGGLLNCLSGSDRQRLISNMEIHICKRNEHVYQNGDLSQYMYIIAEGYVGVLFGSDSNSERMLTVLRKGDIFGYRDYLANHNRSTTVSCIDNVVLYRIPNSVVMEAMENSRKLPALLLENLSKCSRSAEFRYLNMLRKHLRGRLADTLLYLLNRLGAMDDVPKLTVGLKREDLAKMSDMTVANAIRTLSNFVDEGLIRVDRRIIYFLDIPTLERISMVE